MFGRRLDVLAMDMHVEWSGVEWGGVEWGGVERQRAAGRGTAEGGARAEKGGMEHGGIRMLVPAAQRWGRDAQIEI